jgi:hypothetical protein
VTALFQSNKCNKIHTSFAVLGLERQVLVHNAHAAQAAVRSLDVPAAQAHQCSNGQQQQ